MPTPSPSRHRSIRRAAIPAATGVITGLSLSAALVVRAADTPAPAETGPTSPPATAPASTSLPDIADELKYLRAEADSGKYVVTATKTLEEIAKSGSTVTVLTGDQLRKMGAMSVLDALRVVPGVGVTRNLAGTFPELEIRGPKNQGSEKVLFLVDNHPVNMNLLNGGALWAFDGFNIDNVKRVEIVRGPGSALYGANAFAGVVNIITRDAEEIDGGQISATGGSFGTQQYNALYGKAFGDFKVTANFNFLDTDGLRAAIPRDSIFNSGYTKNDRRKYDSDLKLEYNGLWFRGKFSQAGGSPAVSLAHAVSDESEILYRQYFLEAGLTKEILTDVTLQVKVYRDYFDLDNYWEVFPEGFAGGAFPDGAILRSAIKAQRHGGEASVRYEITDANTLVGGVQFEALEQFDAELDANFNPVTGAPMGPVQDLYDRFPYTKETSRTLWALFAEDIWDIRDDLRGIVGLRYDRYSDYGGTINPRTSAIWQFVDEHYLRFSYGSAFRDPTFGEFHNQNNTLVVGNPNLEPETIDTYEVAVRSQFTSHLSTQVTGFYNRIDDLITGIRTPAGTLAFDNVGQAENLGTEGEVRYDFTPGTYAGVNYSFQAPRNITTSEPLPEVPRHRGAIMGNVALPRNLNLYGELLLKGSTERATGDLRDEVSAYGIVNLTLSAHDFLGIRGLDWRFIVENVLDKTYVDPSPANTLVNDYPRPGRAFYGQLTYRF